MEAQITTGEKPSDYSGTTLVKLLGLGIGIGTLASVVLGNVAVGLLLGLTATFWMAIICRRCLA